MIKQYHKIKFENGYPYVEYKGIKYPILVGDLKTGCVAIEIKPYEVILAKYD